MVIVGEWEFVDKNVKKKNENSQKSFDFKKLRKGMNAIFSK